MARTAQTAGLSQQQSVYHTQSFTDHAGQPAIRVRYHSEPIPSNFHAQPVFTFQIYTTIPLNLEEPSAKRSRTSGASPNAERTILADLIDYVGLQVASEAQRPEPLWEIYAEQQGVFECVEHQRREIAHRKAKKEDPSIPPIPKVVRGLHGRDKTGFAIVIDSQDFKNTEFVANQDGAQGPLWVYFDRKFPSKISWEPRLRLEADPEIMGSDVFGPPELPTVLPELIDATFRRIQRVDGMRSELGMMYFSSCKPFDPLPLIQEMMDIGWDEDEGGPDAEWATETLHNVALRLSLDDYNVSRPNATEFKISSTTGISEPDLRYIIHVPFLNEAGMSDKLEQAARAFTYEITSRLSGNTSISFEFYKPPSKSLSSILTAHRNKNRSKNYIGALTTFSGDPFRAYPITRTERASENDPENVPFVPYRTFIVVLERPDFAQVEGGVLFLLADGGKPKPSADQELPDSMKLELQDYVEMELWRFVADIHLIDLPRLYNLGVQNGHYLGPRSSCC
ncbi:hypothetical protein D6C85_01628 [Aureobasidium pullulans]|uniref:Uncharacterized protein n=1 Tax=Aureobasidium pullulans TaxID=5580 RepID=A0A4S9XE03_AURPU|nr:hypothetical protein D6C85_01628 [Aureobasidium pullulans]